MDTVVTGPVVDRHHVFAGAQKPSAAEKPGITAQMGPPIELGNF
jgi:hypothetical protein